MAEDLVPATTSGSFAAMLKRNNKQILEDRAEGILETAEISYLRAIQDMEMQLKRLKRSVENNQDLSPTSADSLILEDNFDSKRFVEEDIQAGVDIKILAEKIAIARDRFKTLFGKEAS